MKFYERDLNFYHYRIACLASEIVRRNFLHPVPQMYVVVKNAILSDIKTRFDENWEKYKDLHWIKER